MDKDLILKVLKDDKFLLDLIKLNSDIEIEKEFEKRNIILSPEDLDEICDVIKVYKSLKENKELTDSEIDKVTGGIISNEIRDLLVSKIRLDLQEGKFLFNSKA